MKQEKQMPNRMSRQTILSKQAYRNNHHYSNAESRWCDLNKVPYARNGYLYGPSTIVDQIANETYYCLDYTDQKGYTKFWTALHENAITPDTLFKAGDNLLVRHQQADVRFKVAGFSPKAKNMFGTRFLNVDWRFNQIKYEQNHVDRHHNHGRYWETQPVETNIQENKIATFWRWVAVPKDTYLKLQLLNLI